MENLKIYTAAVTRVDTFEISVDKKIWDAQALTAWSDIFIAIETTKELAAHLSQLVARQGTRQFYEGFGYVKTIMKDGYPLPSYKKNDTGEYVVLDDNDYCKGILIRRISEDEDCEVKIEKSKESEIKEAWQDNGRDKTEK